MTDDPKKDAIQILGDIGEATIEIGAKVIGNVAEVVGDVVGGAFDVGTAILDSIKSIFDD